MGVKPLLPSGGFNKSVDITSRGAEVRSRRRFYRRTDAPRRYDALGPSAFVLNAGQFDFFRTCDRAWDYIWGRIHRRTRAGPWRARSPSGNSGVFFDPLTRQFCASLGIPASGSMDPRHRLRRAMHLPHRFVGERGEVQGRPRRSAAEAGKARAHRRGLSGTVEQGDEHTAVALSAERPFDAAIIGRLVLVHQHKPGFRARCWRRRVRPGGVLAFRDSDTLFMHHAAAAATLAGVRRWFIAAREAHSTRPGISACRRRPSSAAPDCRRSSTYTVRCSGMVLNLLCQSVAAVIPACCPSYSTAVSSMPREVDIIDTLADRMPPPWKENQSAVRSVAMANCFLRLPG